jgi:hypothetical protein
VGLFDDAVDLVDDGVDGAVEVASDVADGAGDVVEAVVEVPVAVVEAAVSVATAPVEVAVNVATSVGSAASDVVSEATAAVAEAGSFALTLGDDYVFDPVEFVSQGAVKLDYDGSTFTGKVDLGDNGVGLMLGERGFEASGSLDVGVVKTTVSVDEHGVTGSASAGVDWGPLPYAEGHLTVRDDGTVDIGGRAQGTFPTPAGLVIGDVEGGYHQLPDGSWGAYGGVDGTLITPGGVTVSAGGQFAYDEEADGDVVFRAGGHAGVGILGGPSVEVGGEYHHIEDDGKVTEGGSMYVEAEAFGASARAEGDYDHITNADGSTSESYRSGLEAGAYGLEAAAQGQYTHAEMADGTEFDEFQGEVRASAYGQQATVGGRYAETHRTDGTTTTEADAWADVDGLDGASFLSAANEVLGDGSGAPDELGLNTGSMSETVGNLAAGGDLSSVLTQMADDAGVSVADLAGTLALDESFDDFTNDLITTEVAEAAADEVWDDLP